MLQNAYFLAKIGADTAENERNFAEILPKIGNYPTGLPKKEDLAVAAGDAQGSASRGAERPCSGRDAQLRALRRGHRPGACSVRRNWYRSLNAKETRSEVNNFK